jgi:hypothetical protein
MNTELQNYAARLPELIASDDGAPAGQATPRQHFDPPQFNQLALDLFALQYQHNRAYQAICAGRRVAPGTVEHWTQIPAVPTSAFKELELSCIPASERTATFHSSGTTEQKPSRHFHRAESLAVYEASLWKSFARHVGAAGPMMFLTPGPKAAPHSSLIHMFETVRRKLALPETAFAGSLSPDGSWMLDFPEVIQQLQTVVDSAQRLTFLGTAFSFVHLLDYLAEKDLHFRLPSGSRIMETGGYKNRSRTMPKTQLHELITRKLGVPASQIICEYGMSELSSQAYTAPAPAAPILHSSFSILHFPRWSRVQIISPETGREVGEGQTGIIRVFDLANVFSVAAVQTEDLGIRRGDGFELIGRADKAEPRGCSLMTLESAAH